MILGYKFCGPGTRLKERLARGDVGINPLDEACKVHDQVYGLHTDNLRRQEADKRLAEAAWSRVKSKDSSFGEKTAAWLVTSALKAKAKMGGSLGGKKRKTSKKKTKTRKRVHKKKGGFLPLVPIIAGLGALGSVIGGVAGAAKTISAVKTNAEKVKEARRHNQFMETIAAQSGKGLYLRPYKGGGSKRRSNRKSKKKKTKKS